MLSGIEFPRSEEYRTGTENEPLTFYMESLMESTRLDLLLGYFSSSAISVLALGFAKFISNGGKVRFIINHVLSSSDKAALIHGREADVDSFGYSINDFNKLRESLDSYGIHFFECIAWLISTNRIQIRAIKPVGRSGIAHYKSGIFYDDKNKVKFRGSCNFTGAGLLENLEELDIKVSWKTDDAIFFEYEFDYNQIFNGLADYAEIIPFEQVEEIIIREYGGKDLEELLINEQNLVLLKSKEIKSKKHQQVVEKILENIKKYLTTPRFPYESGPRDYQQEAYQNWVNNSYQGIFAMATGTGKTITSLNCVLNESLQTNNCYQTVILVPTTVLLSQWVQEVKKFNFGEIVTVSSETKDWQIQLSRITSQLSFGVNVSFIIIVTYKSFTKAQFQTYFKKLPSSTILLADEAHNIASPAVSRLLESIHLKKRIGLSATPKRIYDPIGSEHMEFFFNDKEPYVYNFSMERAINEGILCPYYYYPKVVSLTSEEMEIYSEISNKLARLYARNANEAVSSKQIEMLLMQRKRIIHKAQGKLAAFESILSEIKSERGQIGYTLVYAPEGYYEDSEFDTDTFPEFTDENRIIDFYSTIIRRVSPGTTLTQYTSESADKDLVLQQFEKGQVNTLLSMKCLDEGVDIPRTEQAIFCSSTGNPRQFIQRRGRILRKHRDKGFAYIYDMVVIPRVDPNSPSFQLERKLVRKELERVVHFAFLSTNKYQATQIFREICQQYDLNLDTIHLDLTS